MIESYKPQSADEISAMEIYHRLIDAWNDKKAHEFAALFSGTAYVIGFDGSLITGQSQVEDQLKTIFGDHETGIYKTKVRDIRHIGEHTMLLLAVAGIVPANSQKIDPSKNAIQSLVVAKTDLGWFIELFQNTPAQFHGKPELSHSLTEELMEL